MSWDEVKNDKEGYIKVRKGDTKALHGRTKRANDDSKAQGYIELKVDDLGFEGGGGPHTHSEYAPKTHTHDEYLTDLPDHDHPHTHDEYLTDLPDHDHPEYEGGAEYDDSEVRDLIQGNADAIAEIQTKGYDDTQIREDFASADADTLSSANDYTDEKIGAIPDPIPYDDTQVKEDIQANAQAIEEIVVPDVSDFVTSEELSTGLSGKADDTHTHDAPDLTHEHSDYIKKEADNSTYKDWLLRANGNKKNPADFAPQHDHPYAGTNHDHDDQYFAKGATSDDDGNPLPHPYVDAYTLGTALDEHGHPDLVYDDKAVKDAINYVGRMVDDLKNESRKGDADLQKALDEHGHDTSHDHDDDYATKLQLEELEVEVEALATTREAGVWTVATTPAVRPGEVHFVTVSMTLADNEVYINNEDANGTVHNWGKLAVGDYLEVVQETKSRSVADYGLFTIVDDLGGEGIRHLKLTQQSGSGSLEGSSDVYIKVFHANNDLDMAELDARYALKSHSHNYASSSHTHNYASSSHSHSYASTNHTHSGLGGSVEAKHGSSTTWESYHGTYGCDKWFAQYRRSDGYKVEATYSKKLSELGEVKIKCNNSGLENKFGRSGLLIGSKSSDPNAYPLVVMTIWKTTQGVVYGYQNMTFEGTVLWVADPNMTFQNVPNLYWTWVGDAK